MPEELKQCRVVLYVVLTEHRYMISNIYTRLPETDLNILEHIKWSSFGNN